MPSHEISNQGIIMGKKRVNWIKAREDYVLDPTITLENISDKYEVSVTVVKERSSKEKWVNLRQEVDKYLAETLPTQAGETQAQYLSRAFKEGKILSDIGLKTLHIRKGSIGTMTAKEMVVEGHKIQKSAMGLDNPQTQINIQNNVYMPLSDLVKAMQKRKEDRENGQQESTAT